MSKLGPNVKITVARSRRVALRDVMTAVFGAAYGSPRPDFDVYTLGDGASLGAYLVADDSALTDDQLRNGGAWLEIVVDDVAAAKRALAAQGIEPFDYFDREHDYLQLPGGQVVRLASAEDRR